ncbi:MAG: hypothetical protein OH338_01365 [Candidatus Parvarchaeota archaeon]|jgi:hypothetical protein|nr:hypothetical protein [Candidatus Parvarchaeum tengchongense]MCW1295836.1 hypothetical protein [Candidatus Parvarchaeum tengchongense]MCW1298987.1 hypothetical protein [Candidatus Parvarchaeum tengchongense]MCW1312063.1 hypothetical protein [Candidatus Parvarchaeum tengchongense]
MNSKQSISKVIKVNSATEKKLWQTAGRLQTLLGRKVSLCEAVEFLFYIYEQKNLSDDEIRNYGRQKAGKY